MTTDHELIARLHKALKYGKVDDARACLNQGVQLDVIDENFEYPLQSVLSLPAQHPDDLKARKATIFRALLEHNPDVLPHVNQQGSHVLHHIAMHDFDDLINDVLEKAPGLLNTPNTNDDYPIHTAVCNGSINTARALLAHEGVGLQQNSDGNLPLHLAVLHGTLDMVKLCTHPEGINTPNARGETPLYLAQCFRNTEIQDYLSQQGGLLEVPGVPRSETYNGSSNF